MREALLRMNGACAAGTGKFLETIARALDLDFGEMVKLDQAADRAATINKTCTVFAESEVVNLVAGGSDLAATIRGVHEMVASKAAALLRQISPEIIPPVVMSGGVAQNGGVVRALADNLGEEVRRPEQPQLIGALGAALIAMEGG